jgi:serpin B
MAACFALAIAGVLTGTTAGQADSLESWKSRLVRANNEFGFSLFYDRTVNQMFENVFISPASVAMALAMACDGADGTTQEAMSNVLGYGGLTAEDVNQATLALLTELATADPGVTLSIANSLWARKGTDIYPEFAADCRQYYGAQVASLDFGSPDAAGFVNDWVSTNTSGRIKDIVGVLSTEDVLLLVNAVYFKGQWQVRFDSALTRDRDFHGMDSTTLVPMMGQSAEFRYLRSEEGFEAVELPYGAGRFSMYVFLPDDSIGLLGFCEYLDSGNWNDWLAGLAFAQGEVVLPKFRLEYEETLNDALTNLGMGVAFDPAAADFSGMTAGRDGLYLSEVKHKAFALVNEEGTEAAAATSVRVTESVAPAAEKPFKMVVDRPFLCAIRDNGTGAILFIGAVYEPQP